MEASYILPLKRAVPYIRLYKNKVFVIKIGGSVLKKPEVLDSVTEDITVLAQLGVSVVVVHGGGPQATELSRQLGHEPTMIAGRRVTGDKDIEIVKMAFAGKVNLDLTAALEEWGTRAVGLSGTDASFMRARRRAPSTPPGSDQQVDWGHVGDIEEVNPAILYHLLGGGYLPVICSLCTDGQGNHLNVNADNVAMAVAVALHAEKLIFLSDTNGLLDDPQDPESTMSFVTPDEIEARKKSGAISGGMLPKIDACLAAVRGGVRRTHIIPGLKPMALLTEVFTNEGCGTMILGPEESRAYARDELAEGGAPAEPQQRPSACGHDHAHGHGHDHPR